MAAVIKWTFEDYWRSQRQSVTYQYAGGPQQFVVPDGVSAIHVTMRGGVGGGDHSLRNQSAGGYVQGWLPVEEGEILWIYVGGNGGNPLGYHGGNGGWNGGGDGGDADPNRPNLLLGGYGGGGATDIRQGGTSLANRVAVAAGSGGTSGFGHPEGVAGPVTGHDAYTFDGTNYNGKGGTQSAGGTRGMGAGGEAASNSTAGDIGVGGRGSDNPVTVGHSGAGGGGAGLYGGGGGGIGYEPSNGTHRDDLRLAEDIDGHHIYAFGGGGGSNYVDGLDSARPIENEPGIAFHRISSNPEPHVSIMYHQTPVTYTMEINPNDGGSPSISKSVLMTQSVGPNRVNILQEGQSQAPVLQFSGIILGQDELESLEYWYDKRIFIKVTDDLGREFYGVFSTFAPHRQRRVSNFWYHTYDATFTLAAYRNASGQFLYGRVM